MKNNPFRGCSAPIDNAALDASEAALEKKLPIPFRQHYLKYNGGIPEDNLFPGNEAWEPLEAAGFYPIKKNRNAANSQNSLLVDHYHFMRSKEVIPENLLPFAHDPGGNFFCLDLADGSVNFYATDGFDPDLSAAENFDKARRRLAGSFDSFMDQLTHNTDYEGDEWPD